MGKSATMVAITSKGRRTGTLTPEAFRKGIDAPKSLFLSDIIKQFNENKEKAGEPERAEQVLESAILESALSFSEKRALQKTVADGMAKLKEGKATFSEKRAIQKAVADAMAKLNAKVDIPDVQLPDGWVKRVGTGDDVYTHANGITMVSVRQPGEVDAGAYRIKVNGDGVYNGYVGGGTGELTIPELLAKALEYTPASVAPNQDLLDLQAGKFDSLDPLAFLGKLKVIADAINDIEPLKAPAIAYIEKNSDKVSAIMESAMQEAFGKLWSAGAGA